MPDKKGWNFLIAAQESLQPLFVWPGKESDLLLLQLHLGAPDQPLGVQHLSFPWIIYSHGSLICAAGMQKPTVRNKSLDLWKGECQSGKLRPQTMKAIWSHHC